MLLSVVSLALWLIGYIYKIALVLVTLGRFYLL